MNDELVESSMNFDAGDVKPFLGRVSPLIEFGFGAAEIDQVVAMVKNLAPDEEGELTFPIRHESRPAELRVRASMGDVDSPELYFFSPPSLALRIEAEMGAFAAERGL